MIDLRSDTVTRPTEGMRRAMLEAPVGDDVFGEDPTVNRLEEYVADLLGKEAALYAPSGTMTNQIGVQVNTNRGEEVLLHEGSHIFVYEAGAPAMLSSVQLRTLSGENGIIDPETVRAAVRPRDVHFPRSRLLCLENTHNTAGGKVFPLEDFAAVAETAKEHGLKVHLDGARLFNAQAATGIPAREWCAPRRHRLRVLLQRTGSAGGFAACRRRGDHQRSPPGPQSLRRGHAPGRHHRRRLPLRLREQRREALRGPRTGPQPRRGAARGGLRCQGT